MELKRRGKDILAKIKQNRITRNAISTEDFLNLLSSLIRTGLIKRHTKQSYRLAAILAEVTGNEPLKTAEQYA